MASDIAVTVATTVAPLPVNNETAAVAREYSGADLISHEAIPNGIKTNTVLSHRVIRVLIRPAASTILSSPRYSTTSQNLYHRISRPGFTGYWVIQSSFTDSQPPRHSDVTIYFLHGGGYFASQPDTYLLFLLRLAEAMVAEGIKVSIFALDYHLAPEYPYPTQLEEAVAAYEYLLHEMAIPAERVVVAGDSAGGHLVLSMLVSLHQRSPLPKPGGAVLLSPWLSLHHTPITNVETDVLSGPFLRATARRFLGPAYADREEMVADPLLEFLNPHPETDWDAVLPSWLWISGGTNEIMFDDLVTWTQALEKRLGRKRVGWEWGEREVHDWQWLETMDEGPKERFLRKEGTCEEFEAVARAGRIIGESVVRGKETSQARSRAARNRHVYPTSTLPPPPPPLLTLSSPGADKTANLARARSRVLEASKAGASLIVLPECFNSPYGCQFFPSYAETLQPSPPTKEQSPSFHALSELAVESKSYLLGGSIPEYVESTKKYHNTSLLFSPQGDLLATHRKVHLFDIDIPGKITFRESDVLSPGNKITLVDIPPYGKIALAICYDVRFPELAAIAARKGCFLLLYPGAFNLTTGPLHWELQARARAVDNQVFVGLCSPARDMEASYHAWGHSMVVYAVLKGEMIEETRKGIPICTQRRFDVYPDVSEGKIKFDE